MLAPVHPTTAAAAALALSDLRCSSPSQSNRLLHTVSKQITVNPLTFALSNCTSSQTETSPINKKNKFWGVLVQRHPLAKLGFTKAHFD